MTHLRWERPSRAHTHELYNSQMRITVRNRSRFFSAMCLCLLTQSYIIAAQTSANEESKPEAGKTIHQMFLDDQDDTPAGKPGGIAPITQAEIKARGEERRRLVSAMLAKGQVQTAEDFHDAPLLFQHAESPDHYLLPHLHASD